MQYRERSFTLVELLIAMAVLVIMMGFLLSFTSGAQRIWTATTSEDNAFQEAQIVMQVLTDDLENIIFKKADTNPDNFAAFYYIEEGTGDIKSCWFTSGYEGDAPHLVIYEYDSTKQELYRILVDDDFGTHTAFELMGNANESNDYNNYISAAKSDSQAATPTLTRNTLCEKMVSFELQSAPSATLLKDEYPRAFRVSFVLEQEAPNGSQTGKYRKFTKTIFLQQNAHL